MLPPKYDYFLFQASDFNSIIYPQQKEHTNREIDYQTKLNNKQTEEKRNPWSDTNF